ncbi:GerMN domain-containing protein [Marinicrinis sediminis]|uniref:GerMN domain-containing protein n=1 Tax=Marinicrinis sediminis TaxID=1652465 RepID=A0ABW5R6A7_9BACL
MKTNKWRRTAIFSFILMLILSGCSLIGSNQENRSIDPPPEQESTELEETMSWGEEGDVGSDMPVTLYVKDAQDYVVPVTIRIPHSEGVAKQVLAYMVDQGPGMEQLPHGFTPILPAGTEVLGMDIIEDKNLAIVDFSEHFTSYNPGDERHLLEAVTWALTSYDAIDQVQIWVEGEPLKEMPVNGTPLDDALTRAMGINLEKVDGVNLAQASAVTLYFQNKTDDQMAYLVPVTRLVDYSDNLAEASMKQWLNGPLPLSSLISLTAADTKLLGIQQAEGHIEVELDASVAAMTGGVVSEDLIQSIVLSLTETTGASHVQVMMGGKGAIQTDEGNVYASPVTRPTEVNSLEL